LRDLVKRPPDLSRPSSDCGDDRHRRPTLGTAQPYVKPGVDRQVEVTVRWTIARYEVTDEMTAATGDQV
jgi:hypothetical protein